MMGCARHWSNRCQTQTTSLVSAGIVRFMRRALRSAMNPVQNHPDDGSQANRAKEEGARDRNRNPGDHDEANGDDGAGFCAGHRQVAEFEPLWLRPLASAEILKHGFAS